jgi:hypothetical protein
MLVGAERECHLDTYSCVCRATEYRMNVRCAHMKSCNATTRVPKDRSAGTFRNAKKVSLERATFVCCALVPCDSTGKEIVVSASCVG